MNVVIDERTLKKMYNFKVQFSSTNTKNYEIYITLIKIC